MRRTKNNLRAFKGWGFDIGALLKSESKKEGEGALSSQPPKAPRAFSTNVSNELPSNPTYEWDHYSGLPGTGAYGEG
jgi:hypothetical protein